jgi:tetratricopeptide (TPR) repeat protein
MFFTIFSFVVAAIVLLNFNSLQAIYYNVLGFYDANTHHFDDFVKHYEQAYYVNPSHPSPLLLAASIHLAKKEEALAFSEFDTAIKTASNPSSYYNHRGKILKARGRTQEAIADWTQAIKLKPNYYAAHYLRGDTYYEQGRYAEALPDFDAAMKADPRWTDSYARKASCLNHFGRNREALDTIKQALTIDPTDPILKAAESHYQEDLRRLGR